MATSEPTRAPICAQSAPTADPDFMTFVDQQIGSTEDSVGAIEDFANAIACGLALEVRKHEPVLGDAIARIGYEITDRVKRLDDMQKAIGDEIYRRRHPDLAGAKTPPDLEAGKAQPEAFECDQAIALEVSNLLRRRLEEQAAGQDRVRRACDLLHVAEWICSGPGWAGDVPDDVDDGNCEIEPSAGDLKVTATRPDSSRSAAKLLDEMAADVTAVKAYAKALSSMSLDDDMDDCFSDPIHQLSDDISKRMTAIEERRDRAWHIVANRVAGDVGGAHV